MREIDLMTDRAHSARVFDHLLGGKTNYLADRAAGDAAIAAAPNARPRTVRVHRPDPVRRRRPEAVSC